MSCRLHNVIRAVIRLGCARLILRFTQRLIKLLSHIHSIFLFIHYLAGLTALSRARSMLVHSNALYKEVFNNARSIGLLQWRFLGGNIGCNCAPDFSFAPPFGLQQNILWPWLGLRSFSSLDAGCNSRPSRPPRLRLGASHPLHVELEPLLAK